MRPYRSYQAARAQEPVTGVRMLRAGRYNVRRNPAVAVVATLGTVANARKATVVVTASSPLEATPLTYSVDYGDGTVLTTASSEHTYATDGAKTVTVTVRDAKGGTTTVTKALAIDTKPVIASATVTLGTGGDADVATAVVVATSPMGLALTYDIDYGEGAPEDTATSTHTYTTTGLKTVTITVSDTNGDTTVIRTVTVVTVSP